MGWVRCPSSILEKSTANLVAISVSGLFACLGLGVGGNLPVDGALFLEYLPFASANMLTMLSVWWPVGQLISRFVDLRNPLYQS